MLGKGGLEAEAPCDAEAMDVEDDDDAEGFVRTSIMEEDEGSDSEPVNDNTSAKRALQKLRKGIVKIRYAALHTNDRVLIDLALPLTT
jgi:hypothetical protein